MPGWCCGEHIWVVLFWLCVAQLVVVGLALLITSLGSRESARPTRQDAGGRNASQTLEERDARGEIDRDEFEERSRAL